MQYRDMVDVVVKVGVNHFFFGDIDHEEACRVLGIPNPDVPRMDGFIGNITLDIHQPTGIHSLYEFEESGVGGGILADDVGLGKTMQVIGLLLHRSNERREATRRGDNVPAARPTLIVMPQGLISQWRDEIISFTNRFHVADYYGSNKKSTDPAVSYFGSSKASRLTIDHPLFDESEATSDTIILTSYTTLSTRHGPKAF
jgi:SNF2 family DNA or RNA helicase